MFHSRIIAADAIATPEAFRHHMRAETGHGYATFRATLTPRYGQAIGDIALGYAALIGLLLWIAQADGIASGIAAAALGAVGVGYLVAYLQLFVDAGAHGHLAADRGINDRLTDWLLCWQTGGSVAAYRAQGDRSAARDSDARLRGAAAHAVIVTVTLMTGAWPVALAWTGGVALVHPYLTTLRDRIARGPALFGDGLIARSFGGAGYNRRLLRALEPQLSYTRLGELEDYLMATSLRPYLDAHRSTLTDALARYLRERHA
jgi:hypothetical protein